MTRRTDLTDAQLGSAGATTGARRKLERRRSSLAAKSRDAATRTPPRVPGLDDRVVRRRPGPTDRLADAQPVARGHNLSRRRDQGAQVDVGR